jgi:hypothetical protein
MSDFYEDFNGITLHQIALGWLQNVFLIKSKEIFAFFGFFSKFLFQNLVKKYCLLRFDR